MFFFFSYLLLFTLSADASYICVYLCSFQTKVWYFRFWFFGILTAQPKSSTTTNTPREAEYGENEEDRKKERQKKKEITHAMKANNNNAMSLFVVVVSAPHLAVWKHGPCAVERLPATEYSTFGSCGCCLRRRTRCQTHICICASVHFSMRDSATMTNQTDYLLFKRIILDSPFSSLRGR